MNSVLSLINAERKTGILLYIGDHNCGCPVYDVAKGRKSAYMGYYDNVTVHNISCLNDDDGLIETEVHEDTPTTHTLHQFDYETHSVVWEVFYAKNGATDLMLNKIALPCIDPGYELHVYCHFYLTKYAADTFVQDRLNDNNDRFYSEIFTIVKVEH